MVFIIKSNNYVRTTYDIDKICKMMINIEQNKYIYNIDGIENDAKESKTPFNLYTYKNVEYNITTSIGVLIIYVKNSSEDVTASNLSNDMINKFIQLDGDEGGSCDNLPVSTPYHKSTYHTLVTLNNNIVPNLIPNTLTNNSLYRLSYRTLIFSLRDFKKACESGTRFIWYVHINHRINTPYLNIVELSERIPNKIYLMRSISTIIYDGNDVFDVKNNTKQINYPSLNQYISYKNDKIIESPVHIKQIYGLDYEIISHFNRKNTEKISKIFYEKSKSFKLVDYKDFKLRRIDRDKLWYNQLHDIFDYDIQELSELNSKETGKPIFPNDICFITRMPLYKHCYIAKVGFISENKQNDDISNVNYVNISYILIAPYLYHSYKDFNQYFTDKCCYSILDMYISLYPRTEVETINLIPSENIDDLKRNLLRCISLNGCCLKNINNCSKTRLYTFDIDTKIVYIGYDSIITDSDIIRHKDTDNILFRFIE